jgi:hypothetical protein
MTCAATWCGTWATPTGLLVVDETGFVEKGGKSAGWSRFLLVRRSLTPNSKGEPELACYLCAAPAGTEDEELIRVAGALPTRTAAWAWSNWRRRHQHRVNTSRYQRRQATYNEMLL